MTPPGCVPDVAIDRLKRLEIDAMMSVGRNDDNEVQYRAAERGSRRCSGPHSRPTESLRALDTTTSRVLAHGYAF